MLPCYIYIGNKKVSLNINWYRNAHFQVSNKIKQAYNPITFSMFKAEKIKIDYTFVWNSNRKTDFMNWIAIADKYFLDWLVTCECIPDDCISNYVSMSVAIKQDLTVKESFICARVTVIE